jgi:hypothetical protein
MSDSRKKTVSLSGLLAMEHRKQNIPVETSSPRMSVVVTLQTYRAENVERLLDALRWQSLPLSVWELVVVSSVPEEEMEEEIKFPWHSRARVIYEAGKGATAAIQRGIAETVAPLIVFLEDDTVLDADYLETAESLADAFIFIGVFGGSVVAEYEEPPPQWVKKHSEMLNIWPCKRAIWSNDFEQLGAVPPVSGMVVRRNVAMAYVDALARDPMRRIFAETEVGREMGCHIDMARMACAQGMGMGRFPDMRLRRIISPKELDRGALPKLYQQKGYMIGALALIWRHKKENEAHEAPKDTLLVRLKKWSALLAHRHFNRARRRGLKLAQSEITKRFEAEKKQRPK